MKNQQLFLNNVSNINNSDESYESITFNKANYSNKEIENKQFYKCIFDSCKFNDSIIKSCKFEKCIFNNCDLSLVKPMYSSFIDVKFVNTKMIGINWTEAAMPLDIHLDNCILNYSSFYGLNLKKIQIKECTSKEVDYSEANMSKANLESTDLSKSKFHNTNLTEANFYNAINYSIDPNSNKLKKTIFSLPEAISLLNSFDILLK